MVDEMLLKTAADKRRKYTAMVNGAFHPLIFSVGGAVSLCTQRVLEFWEDEMTLNTYSALLVSLGVGLAMCGIACSVGAVSEEDFEELVRTVAPRGPDSQATHTINVDGVLIRFHAAVLHLRGDRVTRQPHVDPTSGDVLIYNGEIFDGLDISCHENDGIKLFERLIDADDPYDVFQAVDGPYTFVYYRARARTLHWARDPLGRRSLLVQNRNDGFLLASTAPAAPSNAWQEVPALSVQSLALPTSDFASATRAHVYGFEASTSRLTLPYDPINRLIPLEQDLLGTQEGFPEPRQDFITALSDFRAQLERSIKNRVADIPRLQGPDFPKARVGVLFSGGLDCSVIALLADSYIPDEEAIDLLNVAFENPRSLANKMKNMGEADTFMTPDRLTGLGTYQELKTLRPKRKWNFVQVNVTYATFLARRQHIVDLMYPNNTAMDLSIAQALYFAANGEGLLQDTNKPYRSEARVLLSGLGADEQLGGYSRHKKAFGGMQKPAVQNWSALIEELQVDLDRIGSRNLGRDDRVISSLGKEVRYPFLAAHVVAFLATLPIHLKMDYRFGDGVGDKMLLRALARECGLVGAAGLAKRAIQFGARSAKMEMDSGKLKGHTTLA